jgi:hypothetical protein
MRLYLLNESLAVKKKLKSITRKKAAKVRYATMIILGRL